MSPFVESTQVVTISLGVHIVAFGLFGVVRAVPLGRKHSPDLAELLSDPKLYVLAGGDRRLAYVAAWAVGMLALSTSLALLLAFRVGPFGWLERRFAPAIASSPGWYHVFDEVVPEGAMVFVGCALKDGGYVSGYLDWFSTEAEETADRDLVLAAPLRSYDSNLRELDLQRVGRVVVSARDVERIDVTYVGTSDVDGANRGAADR